MKTHDLARALSTLARSLREADNAELASIAIQANSECSSRGKSSDKSLGANAPAALAILVQLAAYNKNEWRSLINELELDVQVKPTDSVRDIIGRLFKYLNENNDVQQMLVEKAQKASGNVSPKLMKALSILMSK